MKYLKSYKIFESSNSDVEEILSTLNDDNIEYTIGHNLFRIRNSEEVDQDALNDVISKIENILEYKVFKCGSIFHYYPKDKFEEIQNEFNKICESLEVVNEDVQNDHGEEYVYYNSNNEWVFYQDVKYGKFWGNYERYFVKLQEKFNTNEMDLKYLTRYFVEKESRTNIETPIFLSGFLPKK